jgi:hypothetical protein
MTTTATTRIATGTRTTRTRTAATRTRVSWRSGLTTAAIAAAGTTALAAAIRTAGVELGVDGEPIPILGFAQMVLLGGLIGIVLARHVGRTAFVRTSVVLTALSCVPSVALGTTAADKIGLVVTHVVTAAFIVPRLAPR